MPSTMKIRLRPNRLRWFGLQLSLACAAWVLPVEFAAAQLTGQLGAHDPSTIIFDNGRYYYYSTGDLLAVRSSADLTHWNSEPSVFDQVPQSVLNNVQDYQGQSLWAPDVIKLGNEFHLYYSASTFGTKLSGIGLATSPTLDPNDPNYGWTDQGMVITSNHGSPYNAIDPALMLDDDTGRLWMTWGSFNNGIYVKELNPANGQPLNASPGTNVAAPGPTPEIEGATMLQRDGQYYLFTNWGGCCSGSDSTYNIRVGRSSSPTGPFLDRNGVDMLNGGGTLFLDDDGRKVGPGHFSFVDVGGQDMFSYHYYDADLAWVGGQTGFPTFGLRDLHWTADDWPTLVEINPNWSSSRNSDWDQPNNWTGGTVPNGVGEVANFGSQNSGQYSITLPGNRTVGTVNFRGFSSYTVGSAVGPTLTMDDVAGESATLNVAEGSHTLAAPVSALDNLEINVTPITSTLTLSGQIVAPKLTKYGAGQLTLAGGNSTVSGNLFVKNGRLTVTGSLTANSFSSVGQILGETGEMTLVGSGSFTANADFNVGDTGDNFTPATGTLNIQDNAAVVVNSGGGFYVSSGFFANSRADGEVNQSGGSLTVNRPADGSFVIGGRGSSNTNGVYNLSGGMVQANTNVRIGGRGTGSVNQTGGEFNTGESISIGRFAGSSGNWTIQEGTLNQSSSSRFLTVGEQGGGTLTVAANGHVDANGTTQVGMQASGIGTINLDGGMFTARSITGGAGSSTLNFNGGLLRARSSRDTLLQYLTTANVRAGGAIIDTQANNVSFSQPLLHEAALGASPDGGLTKRGSGTLSLTGANTFTGATTVEAGTLRLSGAGAIAASESIQLNAGATLDVSSLPGTFTLSSGQTLNNDNALVIGNVLSGVDSTVTGSGTFTNSVTMQSGSILEVGGSSVSPSQSLAITNGDFETGINPPGDSDVDAWFDVDTFAGASDFWNTAQHEQGLSPTPDAGVLLGDGNGAVGGPLGAGGRWIYQQIGTKAAGGSYTLSLDYGGDNNANTSDRAVSVRAQIYQGTFPSAADDNDIADGGLSLISTLDSPTTSLWGEGNFASFSGSLDLSAANISEPLWIRLSNLPGAGSDPGSWVVIDNVDIQGTVVTSSPNETMTIQGDLTLASGSTASLNIGAAGTNDLLDIHGNLDVADGFTLEVLLDATVSASSLQDGDSWDLFNFATSSGSFDPLAFALPTLSGNLVWDTTRLLVDGVIEVTLPGLPGDFNDDGLVDAADYTVWRDHLGQSESVLPLGSTTDGSGIVDGGDYDTWKNNFGNSSAASLQRASQTNVPEPTTLVLIAMGCSGLLVRSRLGVLTNA